MHELILHRLHCINVGQGLCRVGREQLWSLRIVHNAGPVREVGDQVFEVPEIRQLPGPLRARARGNVVNVVECEVLLYLGVLIEEDGPGRNRKRPLSSHVF